LTDKPVQGNSAFASDFPRELSQQRAHVFAGPSRGYEAHLKLFMAAVFLPEGLSFFIGDFRLSPVRALLLVLLITATLRFFRKVNARGFVRVPSDLVAGFAAIWIVLAGSVTDGLAIGLKSGSVLALEFTGTYYVFRHLLGPINSSTRLIRFSCMLIIIVVGLALLDPLTQRLFTHNFVNALTGYIKEAYDLGSESIFRNGLVRAMGPLEHSILFAAVCTWFGTLALCTFPLGLFSTSIAGIALTGVWFSQSKGPLVAYFIAIALILYYAATRQLTSRWRVLGLLIALGLGFVFLYSRSPIATLLTLGGLDPSAGWYRQAIWQTAGPLVLESPLFGIGIVDDWDWQNSDMLNGPTVDTVWLRTAMTSGIPGSFLVFLTMVSAFWLGPVDQCRNLSRDEQHLSIALGIVIAVAAFLGFTVHFWGSCWILLGVFAGVRANLAEAAIVRRGEAAEGSSPH
jgi:O-antigen ligase